MQAHSILQAKIQELEEAAREATLSDDVESAFMFTQELVPLLLRLADVVGNPDSDRGANR